MKRFACGSEGANSLGATVFRADVAETHVDCPATFKSGFAIDARAPRGRAPLALEVQHADGGWEEIYPKKSARRLSICAPISETTLANRRLCDLDQTLRHPALDRSTGNPDDIAALATKPLISIVMPVYNPCARHLRAAIESVRAQLYPHWEFCVVNDASPRNHVARILARYAQRDQRIKLNSDGERRHRRRLQRRSRPNDRRFRRPARRRRCSRARPRFTLSPVKSTLHPDARLIYSDEDKLDITGRRGNAHFKPDWNYALFLAQNFFSHLGVFKIGADQEGRLSRRFRRIAGLRSRSPLHRASRAGRSGTFPRLLYHWRMSEKSAALSINAKPHARAAAIKAVKEHLARRKDRRGGDQLRRRGFPADSLPLA